MKCLERVEAWFQGEILDRVPIRFHRHNTEYENAQASHHSTLRDRWLDPGESQTIRVSHPDGVTIDAWNLEGRQPQGAQESSQ